MEHLVGIKIKDTIFGIVGFVTWGRIFHPVNPQPLLNVVTKHLPKFGLNNVENMELCETLQEVSSFPYFYEAIFEFSQKTIPDGQEYKTWQKSMRKALEKGEELYFLGLSKEQKAKTLGGSISHGLWYQD